MQIIDKSTKKKGRLGLLANQGRSLDIFGQDKEYARYFKIEFVQTIKGEEQVYQPIKCREEWFEEIGAAWIISKYAQINQTLMCAEDFEKA